jgi:hypothetical protein
MLQSDAKGLLIKSQQKTDEMIEQLVSNSRNERSSRQRNMLDKSKNISQPDTRRTYNRQDKPRLQDDEELSEMTEIQMFSQENASDYRSSAKNPSRGSVANQRPSFKNQNAYDNRSSAKNPSRGSVANQRPSFKNPYVDSDK